MHSVRGFSARIATVVAAREPEGGRRHHRGVQGAQGEETSLPATQCGPQMFGDADDGTIGTPAREDGFVSRASRRAREPHLGNETLRAT